MPSTNCHVNADNVFSFLIDDRVDGDRCLTCLPIANDKVAARDRRHHRIDCFETGLQRFFTVDDPPPRSDSLN